MSPELNLRKLPTSTLDDPGEMYWQNSRRFYDDPLELLDIRLTKGKLIAGHGIFVRSLIKTLSREYPGMVVVSPWPFGARCASLPFHNDGKVVDAKNTPKNDADIFFITPQSGPEFATTVRQIDRPDDIIVGEANSRWGDPYQLALSRIDSEIVCTTEIHHVPLSTTSMQDCMLKYFPFYSTRFGHPVLYTTVKPDSGDLIHQIWQPYPLSRSVNELRIHNPPEQADSPRVLLTALRYLMWSCRASVICNHESFPNAEEEKIILRGVRRFLNSLQPGQISDVLRRFDTCRHIVASLQEHISDPFNYSHSSESQQALWAEVEETQGSTNLTRERVNGIHTLKHSGSRYDQLYQNGYRPLEWFLNKVKAYGFGQIFNVA